MPTPLSKRSVTLPVTLLDFSSDHSRFTDLSCPKCDSQLDIHQPDPNGPGRILGTCEECGDWFLLDLIPHQDRAVMVLLPDSGFFRRALTGESDGAVAG